MYHFIKMVVVLLCMLPNIDEIIAQVSSYIIVTSHVGPERIANLSIGSVTLFNAFRNFIKTKTCLK